MTARRACYWLAALVVASAAVRMALAGRIVTPWIMVDELIYSELAKSFAAHGTFRVRGVPSSGYGFVYPILIAPAFRLFASVPDAYRAAKLINGAVMSLVAVPTYLLARRLLSPALSLLAALLSVLVPAMLYTGMLMTENAFYPLFVACALVLVLALERPTAFLQVAVLALCLLAYATRAQAVALFGAAVVAPVVHGVIERDLRATLRRFAVLYGLIALGVVLALAATVARGRSLLSLLGAYRAATGHGYSLGSVAHYTLWHVAELDLAAGVVGVAALLAMWTSPRSLSSGARAFVAATLPITVLLVVEVAAFASRQSQRIEERNDFYVLPFALVALAGLVAGRGAVPSSRRARVLAAAAAGVLPVAVPFARFVNPSAVSDTFGLLPWWWLQDQGIRFGTLRWIALACGLAAAAASLLPRRLALALPVLVAAFFVLSSLVVENGRHGLHVTSVGSLWAGIRNPRPDWIDRVVGDDADVAFVWHYAGETRPLWNNEFFNRSVGTVYTVDGPDAADGGLPETPVHTLANGTLVTASGRAPVVRYAVSYENLAGTPLASDPRIGLVLYRVDGPLVVLTRITGVYPDTWAGRTVTYRRLRCSGGSLAVRLGTDTHLFAGDQVVTARSGSNVRSVRIAPTAQPTLVVPLQSAGGVCRVTFRARTLRVPGPSDRRRLGAHYYSFTYRS